MAAVVIRSRHSNHVLDVEHGNINAGSRIIQWSKKDDGSVNQHWVFTPDGYIATASNQDLVIDIRGGGGRGTDLILWHKKPFHEAGNQLWDVYDGQIRSRNNYALVLDIPGASTSAGTNIVVWDSNGGNNQKWDFHPLGGAHRNDVSHQTEYFIQSDHSGNVLDIEGTHEGAKVIVSHKNDHAAHQRWVLDQHGFIVNALNHDLALDIANEGEAGTELIVWRKKDDYAWNQKWIVTNDGFIRNRDKDWVLDVVGAATHPGAHVCVWHPKHGGDNINQKWHLVPYHPTAAAAAANPTPSSYTPKYEKDVPAHHTTPTPAYTPKYEKDVPAHHTTPAVPSHITPSGSHHTYWTDIDSVLDQIIKCAASLKGHTTTVRDNYDVLLQQREEAIKRIHGDRERLEESIRHAEGRGREEQERLRQELSVKEQAEREKLAEYDRLIHDANSQKERVQREIESSRGDAETERRRIATLLQDLEQDALSYTRFRPSKPVLSEDDVALIRQLFLSSAVSGGGGKLSFQDLKQVIARYSTTEPAGNLKKLFQLVEADTKGRMSYITMVAVYNDLVALVGDFRTIDTNGNGTLSRKEFREHFTKLGFSHRSALDKLFTFADEDESDDVTFHEFVHLAVTLLVLRILFTAADYDKNGTLSKDEILRILSEAAVPASALAKFPQYYVVIDKDNSGHLDYNEFVLLVLTMFADD